VYKVPEDKADPQTEIPVTNAVVQVTGLEAVQTEEETEADAAAIETTEEDPEVALLQEVATETEAAAEVVMMVARRNREKDSAFYAKNAVISRETVLTSVLEALVMKNAILEDTGTHPEVHLQEATDDTNLPEDAEVTRHPVEETFPDPDPLSTDEETQTREFTKERIIEVLVITNEEAL
jgi:hypothetical protein